MTDSLKFWRKAAQAKIRDGRPLHEPELAAVTLVGMEALAGGKVSLDKAAYMAGWPVDLPELLQEPVV